ncbi:hypothetical protein MMC11_002065 [Xylographa trunciseda]|nr:hypothetical protein [Xylographa trunciseda]
MHREAFASGVTVNGYHFPEGVEVGVPHYALDDNEACYPDPFEFKPSRWLVDSGEVVTKESVQLVQSAFSAFSIGPRGCLGKGVAYMEMFVVRARMMWLFDIRLAEGSTLGEGYPTLVWQKGDGGKARIS